MTSFEQCVRVLRDALDSRLDTVLDHDGVVDVGEQRLLVKSRASGARERFEIAVATVEGAVSSLGYDIWVRQITDLSQIVVMRKK